MNAWAFEDGPQPGTTWVDFKVEFAFRSRMYAQAAGLFKTEVVLRMISAFQQRCQFLLDHKLWPPPGADLAEAEQASLHAAPPALVVSAGAAASTASVRHGRASASVDTGRPAAQPQVSRARPRTALSQGTKSATEHLSIPVAQRMPPPIPAIDPLDTAGKLAQDVWENTLGRRPATRYTRQGEPTAVDGSSSSSQSASSTSRKVVSVPPLPTHGLW